MYWRLKWDTVNFRLLVGKNAPYTSRDFLKVEPFHEFIDEKLLLYKFDDETNLPVPDFPIAVTKGVLICGNDVWSCFKDLRFDLLRTYRARQNGSVLRFCCFLCEISGFDFEASTYSYFENTSDIDQIYDLKLETGFATEYDIFRLNDNWGCRLELIVSDKFNSRYDDNNFTGLSFFPALS